MSGINKAIVVGNLTADPEVRYSNSGAAIANFSVATSEKWKDKNSGQMQEKTEYHRVVMFNRLGEIAGEYLRKGSKVYVEGKLQTRKWQDNSGQDRYTTEIVANTMQMLDQKGADGPNGGQTSQGHHKPPQANQPQQGQQQGGGGGAPNDFDDSDIPF